MGARLRTCVDCLAEGVRTKRPAPFTGPRCKTHNIVAKKVRSKAAHEKRVMEQYGLKLGDYDKLLRAQGGHCAMCPATGKFKRLAIDHDHKCCAGPYSCGRCVRGLLCGNCNSIFGRWRDNADRFRAGAEYLDNPPAQRILNDEVEEGPR